MEDPFSSLPKLKDGWMRLYLARHGETFANAEKIIQGQGVDSELNDNGLSQATKLAEFASKLPLDAIYSSHLKRAHKTAEIVKSFHPEVSHNVLEEIAEMGYGDLEGQTIKECMAELRAITKSWHKGDLHVAAGGGGESVVDVIERGTNGLLNKVLQPSEEAPEKRHVLAVAHGRFNKILLAELVGPGAQHHPNLFNQHNCCVNVIDFNPESGKLLLRVANFTSHL